LLIVHWSFDTTQSVYDVVMQNATIMQSHCDFGFIYPKAWLDRDLYLGAKSSDGRILHSSI
jgi:hypothetical protein